MRTINTITILLVIICYYSIQSVVISDNTNYDSYDQYKRDDLSGEDTGASTGTPRQKQNDIHEVTHTTAKSLNREDVPSPLPPLNTDRSATFRVPNSLNAKFGTDGKSRAPFSSLGIVNSFPTFNQNVVKGGFVNGGFSHSFAAGRFNTSFRNSFPTSFGHNDGSSNGYNNEGGGGSNSGYNNLQPIIHKSVYVHVAPPDDDVPSRPKIVVPQVRPQKNYQIVFIKAPTPPPPAIPIIPPYPPQSDKTLIYVLHPKPEEAPPIRLPTPPPKLLVKPEVYFIRYKTHKENGIEPINLGYRRRNGRNDEEKDEESLDTKETEGKTLQPELNYSSVQYDEDELNDTSGESSNIIQFVTNGRGNNAH